MHSPYIIMIFQLTYCDMLQHLNKNLKISLLKYIHNEF